VSSTTDRRERGQVLALFALFSAVLIMAAALAYDGGMVLLESRDQQNAADAAALAGARFLPANTSSARTQATRIATDNGFTQGVDTGVTITFGRWSPSNGFVAGGGSGAIEVRVSATRPAIFAGIVGRSGWDVSSRAVAVNERTSLGPFALLSLHETACPGMRLEGQGVITSNGNLQVNSVCNTGDKAFRIAGTGTLDLLAADIGCNVVGGATQGGGVSQNDCYNSETGEPANLGADAIPDPYASLGEPYDWLTPPVPPMPAPMVRWDPVLNAAHPEGTRPPAGCPGSNSPATADAPAKCLFGGSFDGQTWRIYPGYYPGGVDFGKGTFLMEPGVYYIGGGGFRVANSSAIMSVDPGADQDDPDANNDGRAGGILIFNSTHPSGTPSPGPVVLQGGSAGLLLHPLVGTGDLADYDFMVIYQDRDVTLDVEIHGGGSLAEVRGVIYAPSAHVLAQGNAGTLTLDQVIASTFAIRGNGGNINVAYDANFIPSYTYAGLVE
jgi:hypothetical protein